VPTAAKTGPATSAKLITARAQRGVRNITAAVGGDAVGCIVKNINYGIFMNDRDSESETRKGRHRRLQRLRKRLSYDDPDKRLIGAIAEQVAEQRVARDLSQKELAELCATSQPAIARLEAGLRPPRIDTLQRVANALDCELEVRLRPRTRTKKEK
jgi:ribosome-binding protein aMBF1 (putative translation factor)